MVDFYFYLNETKKLLLIRNAINLAYHSEYKKLTNECLQDLSLKSSDILRLCFLCPNNSLFLNDYLVFLKNRQIFVNVEQIEINGFYTSLLIVKFIPSAKTLKCRRSITSNCQLDFLCEAVESSDLENLSLRLETYDISDRVVTSFKNLKSLSLHFSIPLGKTCLLKPLISFFETNVSLERLSVSGYLGFLSDDRGCIDFFNSLKKLKIKDLKWTVQYPNVKWISNELLKSLYEIETLRSLCFCDYSVLPKSILPLLGRLKNLYLRDIHVLSLLKDKDIDTNLLEVVEHVKRSHTLRTLEAHFHRFNDDEMWEASNELIYENGSLTYLSLTSAFRELNNNKSISSVKMESRNIFCHTICSKVCTYLLSIAKYKKKGHNILLDIIGKDMVLLIVKLLKSTQIDHRLWSQLRKNDLDLLCSIVKNQKKDGTGSKTEDGGGC